MEDNFLFLPSAMSIYCRFVANFVRTMISIYDFLKIGDRVKEKWGRSFYRHVDFCGLEPVTRGSEFTYDSTPRNSITFASTGGDGVHFGLLTDYSNIKGLQPIVMTVPMMSRNIVLAETLDEFFGLGFYNGWFPLEQLVYSFSETVEYYSTPDNSLSVQEKNFLELMKAELKIKYAPLTKERLEKLGMWYDEKLIV
jgi:hypothetical protein